MEKQQAVKVQDLINEIRFYQKRINSAINSIYEMAEIKPDKSIELIDLKKELFKINTSGKAWNVVWKRFPRVIETREIKELSVDDIKSWDGVGPKTAEEVYTILQSILNSAVVEKI